MSNNNNVREYKVNTVRNTKAIAEDNDGSVIIIY